ncbi:MAG: lysophospholipid acyltransferase family protein [Bacteroidales bacterium]|nr:lysophospholipid acyltransferase family protein [Bacteroidales bacterium]
MEETPIKRSVLDYNDIRKMVPFLDGKEKLVNGLLKLLSVDKVNWIHDHNCDTPGVPFVEGLLKDLNITLRIDNEERLDHLPSGSFITVSNHPLGALDGISLIKIVGQRRPKFKVMVNMVLNYISAMRPNFIAVDALASSDPKKKAVSMQGIKAAMMQVKSGEPMGFFPAGAVSKLNIHGNIDDRKWQPTIIRLIKQMKVPVVPIYFHTRNSWWFNFLGVVSWQLRTLRLPAEVFRKKNSEIHISVGEPIPYEEIAKFDDLDQLGEFLKAKTYAMRALK